MKIEELSLKERLELCRRAERLCAEKFRALYARLAPAEQQLRMVLLDLAEEEEGHARAADRMFERVPWPALWRVNADRIRDLIAEHMPTLAREPVRAPDREDILALAASIEEECIRFYRALEECAPDESSRRFFRHAASEEEGHLDLLSAAPT